MIVRFFIRLDRALKAHETALAIRRAIRPTPQQMIAQSIEDLSQVHSDRGECQSAIDALQESVSIRTAACDVSPSALAGTYTKLSAAFSAMGADDDAAEATQQANIYTAEAAGAAVPATDEPVAVLHPRPPTAETHFTIDELLARPTIAADAAMSATAIPLALATTTVPLADSSPVWPKSNVSDRGSRGSGAVVDTPAGTDESDVDDDGAAAHEHAEERPISGADSGHHSSDDDIAEAPGLEGFVGDGFDSRRESPVMFAGEDVPKATRATLSKPPADNLDTVEERSSSPEYDGWGNDEVTPDILAPTSAPEFLYATDVKSGERSRSNSYLNATDQVGPH